MKHKVSELEGALLDRAVAMANGAKPHEWYYDGLLSCRNCRVSLCCPPWTTAKANSEYPMCGEKDLSRPRYSNDWAIGGPIIEREHIKLAPFSETYWEAVVYDFKRDPDRWPGRGPTPLIAAMRAYVASKLGDEVELP